jgi:hypothetical protein
VCSVNECIITNALFEDGVSSDGFVIHR